MSLQMVAHLLWPMDHGSHAIQWSALEIPEVIHLTSNVSTALRRAEGVHLTLKRRRAS